MRRVLVAFAVGLLFVGAGAAVGISTSGDDQPDSGNVSEADAGTMLQLGVEHNEHRVKAEYERTRFDLSMRETNVMTPVETYERRITSNLFAVDLETRGAAQFYAAGEIGEDEYVRQLVVAHQRAEINREAVDVLRSRTQSEYEFSKGFDQYGRENPPTLLPVVGPDAEALEAVYLGKRDGHITVREREQGVETVIETQNATYRHLNTAAGFGNNELAGETSQMEAISIARDVAGDEWIVSGVTTNNAVNAHIVEFTAADGKGQAVTAVSTASDLVTGHSEVVRRNGTANGTIPIVVASTGPVEPGSERIRIVVLRDGSRLRGAQVFADNESVGETDERGTVELNVPANETVEIRVIDGGTEVVREVTGPVRCSKSNVNDDGDGEQNDKPWVNPSDESDSDAAC